MQEGTLAGSSSHTDPWTSGVSENLINQVFQEDQIRQTQNNVMTARQQWQERLDLLLMYPEDTDAIAEAATHHNIFNLPRVGDIVRVLPKTTRHRGCNTVVWLYDDFFHRARTSISRWIQETFVDLSKQ